MDEEIDAFGSNGSGQGIGLIGSAHVKLVQHHVAGEPA